MSDRSVIQIRQARPLFAPPNKVQSVTIGIDSAIEEPYQEAFDEDAAKLFEALRGALPGGTLDALLCLMLEHKRSGLIVPSERRTS